MAKYLAMYFMITIGAASMIILNSRQPDYEEQLRKNVLSIPNQDVRRCDAAAWPINDEACANIEQAVGDVILKRAEKASK